MCVELIECFIVGAISCSDFVLKITHLNLYLCASLNNWCLLFITEITKRLLAPDLIVLCCATCYFLFLVTYKRLGVARWLKILRSFVEHRRRARLVGKCDRVDIRLTHAMSISSSQQCFGTICSRCQPRRCHDLLSNCIEVPSVEIRHLTL